MSEAMIRLHVEPLEEGGYLATSDDVPGLIAEGRSVAEAVEIAQSLARSLFECSLAYGDPVPEALRIAVGRDSLDLMVPVGIP